MNLSCLHKFRIQITQLSAAIFFGFLILSTSVWEEETPVFSEVLFALGIVLISVASMGRMWCSLYIAGRKTESLVTSGPYSIMRNPLYFFSLLGLIGVGFAAESLLLPVLLTLVFAIIYPVVIRKEEEKLAELHGKEFEDYMQSVPRFFPNFSKLQEPDQFVVFPIIYRKHILSALWFFWVAGFLNFMESLHTAGWVPTYFHIF